MIYDKEDIIQLFGNTYFSKDDGYQTLYLDASDKGKELSNLSIWIIFNYKMIEDNVCDHLQFNYVERLQFMSVGRNQEWVEITVMDNNGGYSAFLVDLRLLRFMCVMICDGVEVLEDHEISTLSRASDFKGM